VKKKGILAIGIMGERNEKVGVSEGRLKLT